jgi:hypothetical protein
MQGVVGQSVMVLLSLEPLWAVAVSWLPDLSHLDEI